MKSAILEKNWRRCSRWVIPNLSISIRLNVSNYERHLHVTIGCHFALFFDRAAIWARLTAQPLTYPFWFSDEYDQLKYQTTTWDTIARLYIQFFWKKLLNFLASANLNSRTVVTEPNLYKDYIKNIITYLVSYLVRTRKIGFVWTCEYTLHECARIYIYFSRIINTLTLPVYKQWEIIWKKNWSEQFLTFRLRFLTFPRFT